MSHDVACCVSRQIPAVRAAETAALLRGIAMDQSIKSFLPVELTGKRVLSESWDAAVGGP